MLFIILLTNSVHTVKNSQETLPCGGVKCHLQESVMDIFSSVDGGGGGSGHDSLGDKAEIF